MDFIDKARFLLSSLYLGKIAKWQKMEGISAMDWFYRYAGKRATESLWRPLLEVKFGASAGNIPASWMAGRLSQRMNSRKLGEEKLGYINGSFYRIIETLTECIKKNGGRIFTGVKVTKVIAENNRIAGVQTLKGDFKGGIFLFTIPTMYAAGLFKDLLPEYSAKLAEIEYLNAVCVVLEMKKKLGDIYWLNVAEPGFSFGGIIEQTNLISEDEYNGTFIAYLSKYYSKNDILSSASNDEIKKTMLADVKKIYPDFNEADLKNVSVFKTATAAPLCDLYFSKKIPKCKTPIDGLYMASMPHVYPDERSCNNAIRVAAEACKVMGIDSSAVPYGSSLAGKIGFS
jgi:protoporphyrinogen oxidase